MAGTTGEVDYAVRRALNRLDSWVDVTGALPKFSGCYYELQAVVEDAVHCGFQRALDQEGPLPSEDALSLSKDLVIEGMEECLRAIRQLSVRLHARNDEDRWYSCPATGECLNDHAGVECTCGADEYNKEMTALFDKLMWHMAKTKQQGQGQKYDSIRRSNKTPS